MPSNAEILAQLEKLSKQMPVIKVLKEPLPVVPRQHGAQFPRSHELENVDVPAILAAFKRLVKIEEAALAARRKRHLAEAIHDQQMERSVEKELPMTYEARKPYFEAADEAGRAEAALDAALKWERGGMKDCPWCHIDPNEIAALKQRVAELERELEAARKVTSCLHDFATAHGKWEAALITDDAAWSGGMAALPTLTETLYAGMIELQRQRAAALAAYRATKEKTNG